MKYIMQNGGLVGELVDESWTADMYVGMFLKSFDAEAHDGRGEVTWTTDPMNAVRFDSLKDLLKVWHTVPEARPVRPDGKPNKPLTSVSIHVVKVYDDD